MYFIHSIRRTRGHCPTILDRPAGLLVRQNLFLATALVLLCSPGFAAIELVCSKADLSRAVVSAGAGDTIVMCSKTWTDVTIEIDANGTSTNPVILKAESPGQTVLTGSTQIRMSGTYIVVDGLVIRGVHKVTDPTSGRTRVIEFRKNSGATCSNCRLTNVSIIDYSPSDFMIRTQWVSLYGQNNRVDHCYFSGKSNRGAVVQNVRTAGGARDSNRIDYNYFGNRPWVAANGIELNLATLQIGTQGKFAYTTADTRAEYNYFYKINSSGDVLVVKSSGSKIRYNVIDSSQGKIMLRQGNNNIVEGNIVHGRDIEGTGGISIRGKGHLIANNHISKTRASSGIGVLPGDAKIDPVLGYLKYPRAEDVTIAFNTVVNSVNSITFGKGRGTVAPRNIRFMNNIVLSGNGPLINVDIAPLQLDMKANIMFGAPLGYQKSTGITVVNPGLRADSGGVYRPTASSPAIGAAIEVVNMPGKARDVDQQLRSLPFDIGADELKSNSTIVKPVTKCSVGPQTYVVDKTCSGNAPPKIPIELTVSD